MITGIGIDLVENARIRDSIDRFGDRFLSRIYTEVEKEYCSKCSHPVIHYAARFAAKEAAFKALGTGWAAGVKWKDVEVRRLGSGKPELHLYGEALAVATEMRATRFHVSLTHDQLISSAVVILEA
jgi:holo-[acyl-carrier protein] synthase